MLAEGAHELFHWLKATAHGAGAPFSQIPLSPAWTVILPKPVEGFFEKIGACCFEVVLQNFGELLRLFRGEIARSLQKAIARTFQNGFVSFLMESFRFIATDLIDGFVEFFYNVKAVQNVECFGKHFGNDFEVYGFHISEQIT